MKSLEAYLRKCGNFNARLENADNPIVVQNNKI